MNDAIHTHMMCTKTTDIILPMTHDRVRDYRDRQTRQGQENLWHRNGRTDVHYKVGNNSADLFSHISSVQLIELNICKFNCALLRIISHRPFTLIPSPSDNSSNLHQSQEWHGAKGRWIWPRQSTLCLWWCHWGLCITSLYDTRLHSDLGPALLVTLAVQSNHHPCQQHHPSLDLILLCTKHCWMHHTVAVTSRDTKPYSKVIIPATL